MSLPKTFQFSATSLQDYAECPRRFQLRYLLEVAWPAPEAEPVSEQERYGRLARDFHRLAHQHLLGIPAETLSATVYDPDLERWWRAYLAYAAPLSGASLRPEIGLSTALARRLRAGNAIESAVGTRRNPASWWRKTGKFWVVTF